MARYHVVVGAAAADLVVHQAEAVELVEAVRLGRLGNMCFLVLPALVKQLAAPAQY